MSKCDALFFLLINQRLIRIELIHQNLVHFTGFSNLSIWGSGLLNPMIVDVQMWCPFFFTHQPAFDTDWIDSSEFGALYRVQQPVHLGFRVAEPDDSGCPNVMPFYFTHQTAFDTDWIDSSEFGALNRVQQPVHLGFRVAEPPARCCVWTDQFHFRGKWIRFGCSLLLLL